MIRSRRIIYTLETLFLDALVLMLAFVVAWQLRDSLGQIILTVAKALGYPLKGAVRTNSTLGILLSTNPLTQFKSHLIVFFLAAPTWLFFLNTQRGYDPHAQRNARQEFGICAYAGMLGTAAMVVCVYLTGFQFSRLLMVGFMCFGIAALWLSRSMLWPLMVKGGRKIERNLIVIGSHLSAQHFASLLHTPAYRGAQLLGFVSDDSYVPAVEVASGPATAGHTAPGIQINYLGNLNNLPDVLDHNVIDEVVLVRSQTDQSGTAAKWGDVLELCLQRGRTVCLVDDMVPPVNAKIEATTMGSMPTLVMHNTPQNPLGLAVKGFMDRVLAFLAVLMFSPIFLVVAALIKLHDRGPIFFTQDRVGLNGRIFKFYKFRSMAVNAQEILEKMKREEPEKYRAINIMEEPFFKAKEGEDPRITPIGKFIRKYSIDELPQFFNVLKGDMSLVGPRPPLPKEVAELEPWQRRKLSVKGGLTCIWQATGRNDITEVDEWMRLDLEYIDNWSLWLDVKLLFKTVQVLIKPKGAS